MTSFTFTCLSFFCMVFSLHELASFVCPLVCGQKGGPPINALYVSYVRGQGLLRFSVLFKFKFLHGHRLSAPSCDTFTASDCTHTITACSCDTFTASTLHAHHHGMLVWHLHGIIIAHTHTITACSWDAWEKAAARMTSFSARHVPRSMHRFGTLWAVQLVTI